MTIDEFLEELAELLEVEETVTLETSLEDMPEYDSLAIMALIAFIDDNFDMTVSGEKVGNLKTVSELVDIIGKDKIA